MQALFLPHLLPGPLLPGRLLSRPNRFLGRVALLDGRVVEAHIADRGRLEGILVPGAEVHLATAPEGGARRTAFTLLLVRCPPLSPERPAVLSMLAPALAPRLVESLIAASLLRGVAPRAIIRRELTVLDSRFDLQATPPRGRPLLIEVKTVVAAAGRAALFPDAPSERATRHTRTLARLARRGERAMIVFVVPRADVAEVRPHPVDPVFARALSRARAAGVELRAVAFEVRLDGLRYDGPRPVRVGANF